MPWGGGQKFSELDLSFLDEVSNDEAEPFEAVVGLPPAGTSSTTAAAMTDLPGVPTPPLLLQRFETSNFILFLFYNFFSLSLVLKNYSINEIRFLFIESSFFFFYFLFLFFFL